MRQYTIFVAQEVYGQLTIEAESPTKVAEFMERLSPNHLYYDRIEWTPQPDDFRVVDTFEDSESNVEYNIHDLAFRHGVAVCPHCGRRLIDSLVKGYTYTCRECDEDFYKFEPKYVLNYNPYEEA